MLTKEFQNGNKNPVREKVFNREQRYRMLCEVFRHLNNDDHISISNIFEQYQNDNLGFVINQDESLCLVEGETRESMYGWSLFQVALALKASKCAIFLLKNKKLCVVPRSD